MSPSYLPVKIVDRRMKRRPKSDFEVGNRGPLDDVLDSVTYLRK